MVSFARTDVTRELVVALDTCAAALSEQSRHVEAAALLREAVHKVREQRDSDPEHDRHLGHYLARLGATLISSGDDEAAVIVLTEAAGLLSSVSGLPERSVILLELSHACRRLGDHEGSAAWLAEHDRTGPLTTADPEVRHKLETTRAGMERSRRGEPAGWMNCGRGAGSTSTSCERWTRTTRRPTPLTSPGTHLARTPVPGGRAAGRSCRRPAPPPRQQRTPRAARARHRPRRLQRLPDRSGPPSGGIRRRSGRGGVI